MKISGILVSFVWAASILTAQALPPLYRIDTVAGSMPNEEAIAAAQAYLTRPACALSDGAGGVLIVEEQAHRIRHVGSDGKIVSFAGTGAFGFSGDGGPAVLAQLNSPKFATRDADGNVYVSDTNNNRVRRIAPDGMITTIAGDGNAAHQGDGKLATAASINSPQGIAVDSNGNLYIAEIGGAFLQDSFIRVVNLATGIISPFAGGQRDPADGIAAKSAWVSTPAQLSMGPGGALVYVDTTLYKVRAITTDGKIKTLAGGANRGSSTNTGDGDGGPASAAKLYSPYGIAVDANGMVYVSDVVGQRVRKFPFAGGTITTVAGNGTPGFAGDGGAGAAARFFNPQCLNVNESGTLLIADRDNQRIRQLSPSGSVSTFAGRTQYAGDNSPALGATLFQPRSVALDANRNLLFTDRGNHVIRIVDSLGVIKLHSGKPNQYAGYGPNTQITGPLAQILWNDPNGIAVRTDGTIHVIDSGTVTTRQIDTKNVVSIFGISGSHVRPTDVAVNPAGTFVTISDPDFDRLHRVNVAAKTFEVLGVGTSGPIADGGLVGNARYKTPEGVAYDPAGNLWIADSSHHRVRRTDSKDIISTMAGTGLAANTGDFGPATAASVYYPMGIAFAPASGIGYISTAHCIRALFTDGTIATIAGTCDAGAFSGDGGPAILARLNAPQGMAVDPAGRVYFADSGNHRIRTLTPVSALKLEIISGDKQSRLATAPLERPLTARLLAQGNLVYPFAPVSWSVSRGSAILSSAVVSTLADGTSTVMATLGESAGPVTVTAFASGLDPVTFNLTARPAPSIATITGAAGNNPVTSPGSLMVISGSSFDPAAACLYINDIVTTMLEVTATRIVAQVPPSSGDTLSIAVSGDCGTSGEVRSAVVPTPVAIAAPEFFYFKNKSVRAEIAGTGEAIGPAGLLADRVYRAARPGEIVVISATGFGPVDPPVDPGAPSSGLANVTLPIVVTLGDLTVSSDDIIYAGAATGRLGQYELRIRIPAGVAVSGDLPIRITVGDAISPDTAVLAVEVPPPPPAIPASTRKR